MWIPGWPWPVSYTHLDVYKRQGQVRSYNKIIEGAGRLLITAFAQRIVETDERENPNQVQLTGTLCKAPAYRTTPFGREIADMMLAVNRAYGKSDYIPCITWGRSARFAAKLSVGDKITLTGRLQSRAYQKQMPDGTVVEKTAYEMCIRDSFESRYDEKEKKIASGRAVTPLQRVSATRRH